MTLTQPLRGAIVRHEQFLGVAVKAQDDGVWVVPVVNPEARNGYRHRADVAHDETLLPRQAVLRAGSPQMVRCSITLCGRVSPATLAAIDAAMAREIRATQFEQRHTPDKHTERCVSL